MKNEIKLECIRKVPEHESLLFSWRMDAETRKMSFHQELMSEEEFISYFDKYFAIKDLPPLFALFDSERVAFVGYCLCDSRRRAAEISIIVAPEKRNSGIGLVVLQAACSFAKQQGYEELWARIKAENSASRRLFEKTGFLFEKEEDSVLFFRKALVQQRNLSPVFIIAEAGSNWRMGTALRDRKMARNLIEAAKEAGADAVKFQTFRPETLYAPHAGKSDYLQEAGIEEEMHELFQDLTMPYEMLSSLAAICQEVGIEFLSTPFSPQDFQRVDPFVLRHKIASYELSHVRLLELAAKSKKPTLLSTGAASIDDIRWAISYFRKCGGEDLTLLHCCAQYPAAPQAMNVLAVHWMQEVFGLPVGLSDHSADPYIAPIMAVSLGAAVIEKHFTLSRRLPGPDHAFAIEPKELTELVRHIRLAEEMRGTGYKRIQEEEKQLHAFARRRIQALQEIKKGELLQEDVNIAILRPGKQKGGVHPRYIEEIIGKKAVRDIPMGEGVRDGDWQ